MIKIAIADDHQLVIDGLKALLEKLPEIELISESNNGKDACLVADHYDLDIMMLDIDMPILSGLQATEILKKKHPDLKILILSMHHEKEVVQKALRVGADGYLLKNTSQDELKDALLTVHAGKKYFSSDITMSLASDFSGKAVQWQYQDIQDDLTEREIEILKRVAMGHTNKEIGEELYISHRTVDTHRTNLMRKLDVKNVAGLIRYALKTRLID